MDVNTSWDWLAAVPLRVSDHATTAAPGDEATAGGTSRSTLGAHVPMLRSMSTSLTLALAPHVRPPSDELAT